MRWLTGHLEFGVTISSARCYEIKVLHDCGFHELIILIRSGLSRLLFPLYRRIFSSCALIECEIPAFFAGASVITRRLFGSIIWKRCSQCKPSISYRYASQLSSFKAFRTIDWYSRQLVWNTGLIALLFRFYKMEVPPKMCLIKSCVCVCFKSLHLDQKKNLLL